MVNDKLSIRLKKVTLFMNLGIVRFWAVLLPIIYFMKVYNRRVDFPCYYFAGERFFNAENLYRLADTWPYKYPPVVAFFFQPLAIFNFDVSKVIFYLLSFFAMTITYGLILGILFKGEKYEKKYLIIPFLLMLRFHFYDFANLQVNSIMLFLIIYGYIQINKNNKIRGAFLFAIGGIFKIIPIFLALFFLMKGRFKSFFYILLALFSIQLLPLLVYGFDGYRELINGYFALMGESHSFYSGSRILQSLPSLIYRFSEYFNILNSDTLKHTLMLPVLLICLIPFILMIRKRSIKEKISLIEFSYCCLFYPLVNPVGWRHSHVFILPAIISIFYYIYKQKLYKQVKYKIAISLYFIFNVFSSKFIAQKSLSHLSDHLSFNVLALFVLFYTLSSIHSNLSVEMNK